MKTTLDQNDKIFPFQKHLAEIVIILPGTTIEEEFRYYNTAINIVATYCQFQEGGAAA